MFGVTPTRSVVTGKHIAQTSDILSDVGSDSVSQQYKDWYEVLKTTLSGTRFLWAAVIGTWWSRTRF